MNTQAKSTILKDKDLYQELALIFREKGFFKKSPARTLAELAVHVVLLFGGVLIFIFIENIWVAIIALSIMTYGSLGIGTSAHSSSHYAISNSPRINRALTYFGFSFIVGISAHYWWHKHCVVHHPNPNLAGVDDDADLMPFFAMNKDEIQNSRGLWRAYYSVQWLFFPFLLSLNLFNLQYTGWVYLVPRLRGSKHRKMAHWLDVSLLIGHYVFWLGIPLFFFPALDVVLFYVLRCVLAGYGMFAILATAHFPEEAVSLHPKLDNKDFILRQTSTTINFRTGFFGHLICSGADYQIEHHLFPSISHHHYPKMSRDVKEFCKRHGYPYRTLGWWEAIWKSFMVFYKPKHLFDSADLCMLRENNAGN